MSRPPGYCAIDFGTSNSAIAVPSAAAMRPVELEPGFPTAVPDRRRTGACRAQLEEALRLVDGVVPGRQVEVDAARHLARRRRRDAEGAVAAEKSEVPPPRSATSTFCSRSHRRLMTVVTHRLGHELLGRAEAAKFAVAEGGTTSIDPGHVEPKLIAALDEARALDTLESDLERIVAAAGTTVRQAGLSPDAVDALYFTGGSTGLRLLADRLQRAFPSARPVRGDRFASVATGLALHAARRFGAPR